jgi:outer membrane lipoprotein-sorting protein
MKKFFVLMLVLSFAVLAAPAFAEEDSAAADLQEVYQDTAAFDGGPGSTINTSPAEADAQ